MPEPSIRDPSPLSWRLTALAFADVAGYSRMMAADSIGTVTLWNTLRETVLLPMMTRHGGRLVEGAGDAVLIEFSSIVRAVSWAVDVQQALTEEAGRQDKEALQLRIGLNIDDVLDDDGTVKSDGVNITARIHQFAKPGEIVLTGVAREVVANRLPVAFRDLGTPRLKNIDRPVRLFAVEMHGLRSGIAQPSLQWSSRPTLAVLPFRTIQGSQEERYFGEGITEDIIAAVSRSRSLFVIARSSTIGFGDIIRNPAAVATALGVKYLLTGTVRRSGDRLRINVELVEVEQVRTVWAERFDGQTADLFDFQDRIAANIVAALEPRVREAETARIGNRPTESLDAYDCVLRALWHLYRFSQDNYGQSRALLERAVLLDPDYAQAHAYLAWCLNFWIGEGHSRDVAADRRRAASASRRAAELDPDDAVALAIRGHVVSFIEHDPEEGLGLFEQALKCDENSPLAWGLSAICHAYLGDGDEARDRFRNVWQLTPYDPINFYYWAGAGLGELVAGRLDDAVGWLRKSYRVKPQFVATLRLLAATLALGGSETEARQIGRELLAIEPGFRVGDFMGWYPLQRTEDRERLTRGLILAGLPE